MNELFKQKIWLYSNKSEVCKSCYSYNHYGLCAYLICPKAYLSDEELDKEIELVKSNV